MNVRVILLGLLGLALFATLFNFAAFEQVSELREQPEPTETQRAISAAPSATSGSEAADDFIGPRTIQEDVALLIKKYQDLNRNGNYEEAEAVARKAKELDPESAAADTALWMSSIKIEEKKWRAKLPHFPESELEHLRQKKETAGERIEKKLLEPVNLNFKDAELEQIVSDLQVVSGLNIVLDERAILDEGGRLDQRLSFKAADISLGSALKLMLRKVRLVYLVKDEAVQITTKQYARGKRTQKVYNVADLVVPVENCPKTSRNALQEALTLHIATNSGTVKPHAPAKVARQDQATNCSTKDSLPDVLVNLITDAVAHDTWRSVGGPGTIQYTPIGMALVVTQTADVHEEISALISQLRRQLDDQVVCEMRMLKIPVDGELCKDLTPLESICLEEHKAKELLKSIDGDGLVNVIQAPKVTVYNGQRACIEAMDQQVFGRRVLQKGFRFSVCPVIAADRRTVRVEVAARLDDVNAEQSGMSSLLVERAIRIGDGQTALLCCGTITEETKMEVPVLSSLPVVGPLLPKLGASRETFRIVIMVTPRIVHTEESAVSSRF